MIRSSASSFAPSESVAIIGGGLSGAILATQLLRKSAGNVSVVLVERDPCLGRGVAYGTRCTEHLLNVAARDMSALPENPEHFLRWARCHHDPSVQGGEFLPRRLYGDYVHSLLRREMERYPGCLEQIHDEAVALECRGNGAEVQLRCGPTRKANKVVLALGNFPPANLPLPEQTLRSPRYIRDPWAPGALDCTALNDEVLLVGSGLTSVDVLIALRASGNTGNIHFLSRHGLLPNPHRSTGPWPSFLPLLPSMTLVEWMRRVRVQVLVAHMRGYDWRAVIDALRPAIPLIWHSLSAHEQRRFLRHLRPFWEVHRHRIAPEVAARLEAEIALGLAEVHAGRIMACEEDAGGISVCFRDRRHGSLRQLRVQRIVNCTGPETDCRRVQSPLLAGLLLAGLARPDRFSLGLDCDEDGALIDAHGAPSTVLYALGPARKGGLWESTAVPEIRVQASELAELLVSVRCWETAASAETSPSTPQNSSRASLQSLSATQRHIAD
jgi:uncharacterized NAD(P)/FAD-binding protein YdhS